MNFLTEKEILKIITGKEYKTLKEATEELEKEVVKLEKIWIDSNFTDVSVYNHPLYILDAYLYWYFVSKMCIKNMVKYFKLNVSNWSDLTYFDDYNGIGLTTLYLLSEGFKNVFWKAGSEDQKDLFKKFCGILNVPIPLEGERSGVYDVFISFEIMEHERNCLKYIKDTINQNPQYFVLSTNFKPEHGRIYTGHFPVYTVDSKEVNPRSIGKYKNKLLREKYEMVWNGFNHKPWVWKRKE